MSDTKQSQSTKVKHEHGTTKSYVIGFLLSLVFSLIPYYMVVNKTATGSVLLAYILGFAVIQMFIQIFFFLHLGRGPKPFYNVVFFFATAGTIVMVVVGSVFIMNNLYHNMTPAEVTKNLAEKEGIYQISGEKTGACHGRGANHKVTISGGKVTPIYTEARLCDTLSIINEDQGVRDIAFGPHPNHDNYSGESEISVRNGRAKTITLNQAGTYMFHDHNEPTTAGNFSVTQE